MKLRTFLSSIFVFSLLIFACSPDEPEISLVPDRDRTEQQATDKALLLSYLGTHYYNSADLAAIINPEPSDIIITELAEGATVPMGHTLLAGAVETRTTVFEEATYEYYILKINQGGGDESPNFTDKVRVEYEGSLIEDASVFDSAINPVDFNLVGFGVNSGGVITGWQRVFPEFNTAASFTTGSNVEYDDYGVGVMFLPSGLAYFSTQLVGIPSYSNLIFKFTLFQTEINDHDSDGVPSYIEDLNNNSSTFDEDTDDNSIVNYVDPDDDGDGVLTINELFRTEYIVDTNNGESEPELDNNEFELGRTQSMGVITITTGKILDTDNNNIPDYLDEDITINYNE
ncbi:MULTISPECIES: FKBP-type peptidyl-prolyl cis-trans isomerase [unclassified Winogradskyella]|uniref:FKBP-type peptidyl-prolyl cis-trans isomerase n=1 Tax=unclassified Winogradskyella TaxID=2615021 RepID=UPI0012FC681A|nr:MULTISPECIES: FKBP-type peptidyl-prolyl cis-trans isomerase [unclassified Winogradskyella]